MAVENILAEPRSNQGHTMILRNPPTNVPTRYQLPTPYDGQAIAQKNYLCLGHYDKVKDKSRSHSNAAYLHLQLISLPFINFLNLSVFQDIAHDFKRQGHYSKVKGRVKVTL